MEIKLNNINMNNLNDFTINIKDGIIGFIDLTSDSQNNILKEINGNIDVSTYEVIIDGKTKEQYSKNIGFVHRFANDYFSKETVKEEIEYNLEKKGYNKSDKEKRVLNSLKMTGMLDYLNQNPFELSNGQKKNILIAIALSHNPKILLLDEPTLGIDYQSKKRLIQLLKIMKFKYNKKILIWSNDIDFVYEIVDYIYVLENGKIVNKGDKDTILKWLTLEKKFIKLPKIIEFSNYVKDIKKVNLGYRDNLDDLAKDIYRNV